MTDHMKSTNIITKTAIKSSIIIIKSIKEIIGFLLSLSLNTELEILLWKFLKVMPNHHLFQSIAVNFYIVNKIYTEIIA